MEQFSHKYFMQKAIEKAHEGIDNGQSPFGACIIKNNRIVACVHNVVWETTDITAHAEINCIRQACHALNEIDLSGCTIYSTCEPCPMCFSACHWARIETIYYGTSIADAQNCGFNELAISNKTLKKLGDSPIEVHGNILREEALELFTRWQKEFGNKLY